jgi:hypothetical protein
MKKGSSARRNDDRTRKRPVYVKSAAEIPGFKSEDEIAAWYQTHSTVLIQDQLETLPARVGAANSVRAWPPVAATVTVGPNRVRPRPSVAPAPPGPPDASPLTQGCWP